MKEHKWKTNKCRMGSERTNLGLGITTQWKHRNWTLSQKRGALITVKEPFCCWGNITQREPVLPRALAARIPCCRRQTVISSSTSEDKHLASQKALACLKERKRAVHWHDSDASRHQAQKSMQGGVQVLLQLWHTKRGFAWSSFVVWERRLRVRVL